MTKTIAKIWAGAFDVAQYSGLNNPEIKELLHLLSNQHRKLLDVVDENLKNEIEKFDLTHGEYTSRLCEEAFCDGFCIATKILTEALGGGSYLE